MSKDKTNYPLFFPPGWEEPTDVGVLKVRVLDLDAVPRSLQLCLQMQDGRYVSQLLQVADVEKPFGVELLMHTVRWLERALDVTT